MERIAHARIGEDGHIYGKKGDQTKQEVAITDYYSYPWDFVAIHPDASVRNKHAEISIQICNNDNIGYSQYERNTLWDEVRKIKGRDVTKVALCNCDCSSMQHVACMLSGGMPDDSYTTNCFYTAVEESYLKKYGYIIIKDQKIINDPSYCVKGAIYCKAGHHTVNSIDNGKNYMETLKVAGVNMEEKYSEEYIGNWQATAPLNIRENAGTNYSRVCTISKNDVVHCDGYYKELENKWMRVTTNDGKTGYASTLYLKQISKDQSNSWKNCQYRILENGNIEIKGVSVK